MSVTHPVDPNDADDEDEIPFDLTAKGAEVGLQLMAVAVEQLAVLCHQTSVTRGYYPPGDPPPTFAHSMGLVMTELAEVVECERKKWVATPSEKIPAYTRLEEEVADAVIRLMDFSGLHGLDVGGAVVAKLLFNRAQSQTANRVY